MPQKMGPRKKYSYAFSGLAKPQNPWNTQEYPYII